jgi:hypothetical protein
MMMSGMWDGSGSMGVLFLVRVVLGIAALSKYLLFNNRR